MALQRPVSKALACSNCQRWVLRSFITGIAGQSANPTTPLRQRAFSRTAHVRSREDDHPLNDINDGFSNITKPTPPQIIEQPTKDDQTKEEHVPWYLRVQQPLEPQQSPFSSRQQIPEAPIHSPALLEPLMQHVSVELGMDDLALLDLRTLDPPPALGANLLMIIGTARSEKHLHVSADRLCRWLRTEHRLTPYADGLLGRNELKLKLRRKAKRSRLLSAVGAKTTADTETDDGIRTGWVCVSVGRVEGGELPKEQWEVDQTASFVGFGSSTDGCSVVVQMMTEEKRDEIDLEKLWTGMLERAKGTKENDNAETVGTLGLANDGSGVELKSTTPLPRQQASDVSVLHPTMHQVSNPTTSQQLRTYHTSARVMQATAAMTSNLDHTAVQTNSDLDVYTSHEMDPSLVSLSDQLAKLQTMSTYRAFEALGPDLLSAAEHLNPCPEEGTATKPSTNLTPFINEFYNSMPTFPNEQHWHMHIALLAHARARGHQSVHSPVLTAQLRNMQIAGLIPEERTFKLVLRSALAPLGKVNPYDGTARMPGPGKMHAVFDILEDMEACGFDPVQPDVLELLYAACIGPPPSAKEAEHSRCYELSSILSHLSAARLRRHVLDADWDAFWKTWRSYPQRFLPRTREMYEVLFAAIADGDIATATAREVALRDALEDMPREQPAVVLEEGDLKVVKALKGALEAVQPALKNGDGKRAVAKEWTGVYERCLRLLDAQD